VSNVAEDAAALQCGESCWLSHKIHCRDSPVNRKRQRRLRVVQRACEWIIGTPTPAENRSFWPLLEYSSLRHQHTG